jgi:hypothetical protein
MKLAPFGAVAAAILFIIAGCSSGDITNPNQIVFPADSVSYARQVAPYFALTCTTSGCHDGSANTAGGVDLTTWIGVRAINVLTPRDTTTSQLVLVMKGKTQHSWPFSANENQREGITRWVFEGAQNN